MGGAILESVLLPPLCGIVGGMIGSFLMECASFSAIMKAGTSLSRKLFYFLPLSVLCGALLGLVFILSFETYLACLCLFYMTMVGAIWKNIVLSFGTFWGVIRKVLRAQL